MVWYFPWSNSIKNRAVRYLLQKYVGQFLKEKLTLDQLSVDLYSGTGTIQEVLLDVGALNEALDNYNVPLEIVDGFIGSISVTVPWSALVNESTLVEIRNLELTIQPRQREDLETPGVMLESVFSSMTSSMELAKECLQQSPSEAEKEAEGAQPFEGLEKFAQTIEAVLSRIKMTFVDTVVRLEHLPKDGSTGAGLEFRIARVEFFDDQAREASSPVDTTPSSPQNIYEPAAFAHKNFYLMGVVLFCDEFLKNQRDRSRSQSMYFSTQAGEGFGSSVDLAESPPLAPPAPSITQQSASTQDDGLQLEMDSVPIKVAVFQGRQEVKLKIKQNDELPGPKLELECQLGNLHTHLSPRQVHLLLEITNGIISPSQSQDSKGHKKSRNKPMAESDFARVEQDLQRQLQSGRLHDSERIRSLNEEVLLNQSLDERDVYYDLASQSGVTSMESSFTSSVSHSTSTAPSSTTLPSTYNIPGRKDTSRPPRGSRAKQKSTKHKDSMQRLMDDPAADTNCYKLRISFFSFMLLHEDPPHTPSDGIDPAQTSTEKLKAMSEKYFSRIQGINPAGVDVDLVKLREQFSEACPLDHISCICKPLILDCTEKVTSHGYSISIEATIGLTEIVEAVFDRRGSTSSMYGFSLPIDNILPDYCELLTFSPEEEEKKPSMFSSMHSSTAPSVRLKVNHVERKGQSSRRHSDIPRTDVHLELARCHSEVDISIVDRIHSLLNPQPLVSVDANGARMKSFNTSLAQSRHAYFSSAMDEGSPAESERKVDFSLSGSSITLALRFPIPDLRTGQNVDRMPWWRRSLRREVLLAEVIDGQLSTTIGQSEGGWKVEVTCRECHGSFLLDPKKQPVPFISIGQAVHDETMPREREEGFDWPRVVVKGFPQNPSLLTQQQDDSEAVPLDSLNGACQFEKLDSSPFSTRKVMYDEQEMVLPGDKEEMLKFQDKAVANTKLVIELTLPSVNCYLPDKEFLDMIYNRITNDLLMWEPLAPSPVNPMDQFNMPTTLTSGLDLATQILYEGHGDNFIQCKSGIQYDSSSDSDDMSDQFYSVYDHRQRARKRPTQKVSQQPSNTCVCLSIGKGKVTARLPLKKEPEKSEPAGASAYGEFCLQVEDGSIFVVTEYGGDPELRYICIQGHKAVLCHEGKFEEFRQAPTLGRVDLTPPSHLHPTIQLSDGGVVTKLGGTVGQGGNTLDMISVAISIKGDTFTNVRETKVAAGFRGATLRHRMTSSEESWLMQLMDLLDLKDIDVLGYSPPPALVELHIHFWSCAVDYRPVNLPVSSLLTVESFSISSNVVVDSTVSLLRFLVDDTALYLSRKRNPDAVDLRRDYVCVADMGSFELSLKTSDGKDPRYPKVDLQASNNILHLRTCADSCRMLQELIVYIANDGDLSGMCTESMSETEHSEADSEVPDLPRTTQATGLSQSNMEQVHDMVADAMQESTGSSSSPSVQSPDGVRKPSEIFFFPGESQSIHQPQVPSRLPQVPSHQAAGEDTVREISVAMDDSVSSSSNLSGGDENEQLSEDEEFCIIDDPGLGIAPKDGAPTVRVLAQDVIHIKDNHFAMPLGKIDQLKAPERFPLPMYRYTIKEMSLVWYMYGGSDFLPSKEEKKGKLGAATGEGEVFQSDGGAVGFRKAGARSPEKMGKLGWQARGGVGRDIDTLMELQLNKVRLQYDLYPEHTEQASRQVLLIHDIEIRDRLVSSQINKFLYRYSSEAMPRQSHANMLLIKALHVRKPPGQECCLRVSIQPVRLNIDQDALFFLRNFFTAIAEGAEEGESSSGRSQGTSSKSGSAPPPVMAVGQAASPPHDDPQNLLIMFDEITDKDEEDDEDDDISEHSHSAEQPVYFRKFLFSPDVPIRLDYHGKRVAREHGTLAGVLVGLAQLNCSELRLKRLCLDRGILGVDKLLSKMIEEWTTDIRKNQLPSILGGVGPMHSLVQLVHGLFDLFWLPVEQYRKDGRIVRGLQRGAHSFTTSTAMAALELTNRLVQSLQFVAEVAYDMVSPGPSVRRRKRQRKSRKTQPADLREGFTTAYHVVREGIQDTAETIVRVATEEHEQKGMTGAVGGVLRQIPPTVIQPVILATVATSSVLGGMRNQLLPDKKKEEEEKWKPDESL